MVTMTESSDAQTTGLARHRLIGLMLGPVLALVIIASPAPADLSQHGWYTAAVAVWMAVWWMTEALPLAVTAMLPLILFPILGVSDIGATAPSYAHPLIFLFLGGFLLARAMHVWGLDQRLALNVLRLAGSSPRNVIVNTAVAEAVQVEVSLLEASGVNLDVLRTLHHRDVCVTMLCHKAVQHKSRLPLPLTSVEQLNLFLQFRLPLICSSILRNNGEPSSMSIFHALKQLDGSHIRGTMCSLFKVVIQALVVFPVERVFMIRMSNELLFN